MNNEAVIKYIVSWLKDYAEKAGMNGFVVGVSGGVDSAVVSALAARTGMKVLLLEMPIRQKADQIDRAQAHIADLVGKFANVEGMSVDLTPTFEAFEQTVDVDATAFPTRDLAFANARSRLRMTTLYYYGQIHHLLVAGTGNKVEDFGVGFFTKYGDGGVDLSPIGDLLKTEVYALARSLDIIESIQQAVPTDGLWDAERTDEEQMGASYPELEWAMSVYSTQPIESFSGRQREVLEIYGRLNRAMQHKIRPIPVCTIPDDLKHDDATQHNEKAV